MNEKKTSWKCPVCDKPALFENLLIDGYFLDVINSINLDSEENEILLHKDGSWSVFSKKSVGRKEIKEKLESSILEISSDEEGKRLINVNSRFNLKLNFWFKKIENLIQVSIY